MVGTMFSAVLACAVYWHSGAAPVVARAWLDMQELVRVLEVLARRVG